jgi:hypothetical protein
MGATAAATTTTSAIPTQAKGIKASLKPAPSVHVKARNMHRHQGKVLYNRAQNVVTKASKKDDFLMIADVGDRMGHKDVPYSSLYE